MDNLFDLEDVLILEDVFVDTLSKLNIYIEESLALYLDVDIHGYEKHTYYHEFRLIDWQSISFSKFTMLDKVEPSSYGFIDDEEYNEESGLITEGETATFSIETTIVEPFTKEIAFVYLINGEPSEIDRISMFRRLYIELDIHGCKKNALFWESSAYISYLMYKNKNYVGSFMHLFIAFEGLLRFLTENTGASKLEKVYQSYTGKEFSLQMQKYKMLRNKIMHGNDGQALKIDEEILLHLLEEIKELYFMKKQ